MIIEQLGRDTPAADGVTWQLQRGTVVHLTGNLYPQGSITIEAVGDGPPPVIQVPAEYQLAFMAKPGQTVRVHGVHIEGPLGGKPGSGWAVGKGGRFVGRDIAAAGFSNGVLISGDDSEVDGLAVWDVDTGIDGGRPDLPAPSRCRLERLHIRASSDAITLHDGTGTGRDNIIRSATLHAGRENGIDLQGMYAGTLVEDVVISCPAGLYPAIWDGAGTTLRRVRIAAAQRPIYSRGAGATIHACDLGATASPRTAALLAFAPGATGQIVHDCQGTVLPGSKRPALLAETGSGGVLRRLRVSNLSDMPTMGGDWAHWVLQ